MDKAVFKKKLLGQFLPRLGRIGLREYDDHNFVYKNFESA